MPDLYNITPVAQSGGDPLLLLKAANNLVDGALAISLLLSLFLILFFTQLSIRGREDVVASFASSTFVTCIVGLLMVAGTIVAFDKIWWFLLLMALAAGLSFIKSRPN